MNDPLAKNMGQMLWEKLIAAHITVAENPFSH